MIRSSILLLGATTVAAQSCDTTISFAPATKADLRTALTDCLGHADSGIATLSSTGDCCADSAGNVVAATNGVCPSETVHLTQWDTSSITDFQYLIAASLMDGADFNQCLCAWDFSGSTGQPFYILGGATNYNQDLSCWEGNIPPDDTVAIHAAVFHAVDAYGSFGSLQPVAACLTNDVEGDCDQTTTCKIPCEGGDAVSDAGDTGGAGDAVGDAGDTGAGAADAATCAPLGQGDCCSTEGCAFSNSDCVPSDQLYGNPDECKACAENEHVLGYDCVPCPAGTFRPAGDDPSGKDTACGPSCGGDVCVEANTDACTSGVCECKAGFGGASCEKDVTAVGLQAMLSESRKKALPTEQDLITRQNTIKTFVRDTLKQKIKEGKTVKQAILETKVPVEPADLPQKAQAIIQQLAKPPVVAVAPANKDEEDTCAQGANSAGCGMVDVNSGADEIVILSTDPEPGSWSVLTSSGDIVSKQTRVSQFVYEMQCWDNGWGVKETVDTSDGAQMYVCNGNVVMIGSQAGICTDTTCNDGTCIVDGDSYSCQCDAGFSGDHCETEGVQTKCFDFDCSNYGGHKSFDACDGACSAAVCCNYDTKSAFNTVCDGLQSAADYVSNKCCHRDICI